MKIKADGQILRRHVSEKGCDLYSDELFDCGTVFLAPEIPRTISRIAPLQKQLDNTELRLKNTTEALNRTTAELNRCKGENENMKRRIDESKRENDKLKDRQKTFSEINEWWQGMENSFSEMREDMRSIMPNYESMVSFSGANEIVAVSLLSTMTRCVHLALLLSDKKPSAAHSPLS